MRTERHIVSKAWAATAAGLIVAMIAASPGVAGGATTRRLSVSSGGRQGNANSYGATTAGRGRYVVFESNASDLVRGDTNGVTDIFERNRSTGKTIRVSVSSGGKQGNGPSHSARGVTPNGRFVVFESFATNLVPGDTNGTWDVFVRDTVARKTYLVSRNSAGREGNRASSDPTISADGRYVAFESFASNLVKGDTNGWVDAFVRDRRTHTTRRVSVSSRGRQGNENSSDAVISGSGRYVAFESLASNLVRGDTNGTSDIFVRDMSAHTTRRMSVSSGGAQGNNAGFIGHHGSHSAAISANGRYVAFESFSSNLAKGDTNRVCDVFVRDRATHHTFLVSRNSNGREGNKFSSDPAISNDGRYVTFESGATNLTRNDTNGKVDVIVRNRAAGRTFRASLSPAGHQGNGESSDPSISGNGTFIVFESEASNLVAHDTNGRSDVLDRGPIG
jgi:Tol biopolymer transport system component